MPTQGYTRFITQETLNKLHNIIQHRQFHPETGFPIIHHKPYYGLPQELAETIDKHNWKSFVQHSSDNHLYGSIVQVFYSCILDRTQKYVFVRGFPVYFTPKYINFHYGLIKNPECDDDDDIVDEYQDLKNTVSQESLTCIMKTLTVEGTDWKEEEGKKILKVSWDALKPVPKVWYQFICARLLPSSDFEDVDRDRLLLLHCILEGRSINVGKIIYDEIIDCAFKTKETDRLLFASLISDLCISNGVHAEDDDDDNEVLMNEEAIELDSVKEFYQEEAEKRERLEEEKFVGGDEGFVRRAILKHMQQDRKFWRFYKEALIYQRNMFELNFDNGDLNPPEFPDEILEPLMTDDPMHGKDPATGEAEDNGDDSKGREKEKSDLSAVPSSQSSSSRLETKVNQEEEVVGMKQVHPVITYRKKRFKTTACRRRTCSKLDIVLL